MIKAKKKENTKDKPLYKLIEEYEGEVKLSFRKNLGVMIGELSKKMLEQAKDV